MLLYACIQCFYDVLGEIIDFFNRVEFQLRGTPHMHGMYAGDRDSIPSAGDVHSDDIEIKSKVIAFVDSKVMGTIVGLPPNDDLDGVDSDLHSTFDDNVDPRRGVFNKELNYSLPLNPNENLDVNNGVLTDYRNIQLATNMHVCTFTCLKYGGKICRFGYPRSVSSSTTIVHDRDRKQRARTRVLPSNNNAYFNPHIKSPLYICAQRCNTDIQYIANKRGAAEYCTSYALKAEEPDGESLLKFMIRYYINKELEGETISRKDHYKGLGYSLLNATPITTAQACWFLLGLPFVYKSRTVVSVNTLPTQLLPSVLITNELVLRNMNPTDSISCTGPNTQIGRRKAYACLAQQQLETYNVCHITYFVYVTNLTCEIYNSESKSHREYPIAPLLFLKPTSCILDLSIKGFRVGDLYVYKPYRIPVVVKVSPYKRLDPDDELCCFSLLLLHKPFINEDSILSTNSITGLKNSAITELLLYQKHFPTYITNILDSMYHSQNMLDNQGTIKVSDEDIEYDDDDSGSETSNEDVYKEHQQDIENDISNGDEEPTAEVLPMHTIIQGTLYYLFSEKIQIIHSYHRCITYIIKRR
jgi:hypothetical protein